MDLATLSSGLHNFTEIDFYAEDENEDFDTDEFDFDTSDSDDQITILD